MSDFFGDRKQERMMAYCAPSDMIDDRTYNLAMGAVVLYGLFANFFVCLYGMDTAVNLVGSNPILFIIMYFVLCIAGVFISHKSDSPVISFLGYNLIVVPMGLVVAVSVYCYGGVSSPVVSQAVLYTGIITACMIGLATAFPGFFSRLGGILLAGLIGLVICEIIMLIVGVDIFSLYIGYDFWKAQEYPRTLDNAVDSAVDIYVDIIGLFLRILRILGNSRSSSR